MTGRRTFAARMRSLQQDITFEDRQRNIPIFYDRVFDLRWNGTVKRVGLVFWAVLLLCSALSTFSSVVSNTPAAIAHATCV